MSTYKKIDVYENTSVMNICEMSLKRKFKIQYFKKYLMIDDAFLGYGQEKFCGKNCYGYEIKEDLGDFKLPKFQNFFSKG